MPISKRSLLNTLIYIFAVEKTLQHLLTAVFFLVNIPNIGTPDIGSNFQITNPTMALLNLIYFIFFVTGIAGKIKSRKWASSLLIFLAVLDIILEFVFHHFFYITVSGREFNKRETKAHLMSKRLIHT